MRLGVNEITPAKDKRSQKRRRIQIEHADPNASLSFTTIPPSTQKRKAEELSNVAEVLPDLSNVAEVLPDFPRDVDEEMEEDDSGHDLGTEFLPVAEDPVHCNQRSLVLNYDRSNLDSRHVIIPFDELIKFMDTNFVCKKCLKSSCTYQRQTRGIATSLNWFCTCRAGGSIKARLRTNDEERNKKWKDATWTRLQPVAAYQLNIRFVLGLQQCGGGEADSAVHAAMLDLGVSPFKATWQKVEEEIAIVEVEVGKKIVDDNIKLEIKLTKERDLGVLIDRMHGRSEEHKSPKEYLPLTDIDTVDVDDKKQVHHLICKPCRVVVAERKEANKNKTPISVQGDCRWDQRKGGRAYNSDSGTHLLVGNESLKTVAVECISRRCSKCEREKAHPENICPKNYVGSSKGMEPEGALRNVKLLYEEKDVVIQTFVMDDDSSTKSILRHSWKLLVESGLLDMLDWPRTKSGYKKKDNGQLPLLHPPIDWLADKNHRVRTYAKYFFILAHKKRSFTSCTTNDAERMKRNFSYFIHMYRHASFKEFKKAAKAVLEHHFNNHEFCGDWCPANRWKDDEKKLKALKYRSKETDAELYEQMSTIHDTFTDVWNLRDIYHEVHSNKCESLNGFITKFLPKHKHYCRTIVNRARTYLAIGIDSVGYRNYYRILLKRLGIDSTILSGVHHNRLDERTKKKSRYDQSEKAKKSRKQKLNDKLREASELLMQDKKKGRTYGSNIGGPQVEGKGLDGSEVIDLVEPGSRKKKDGTKKKQSICSWCHIVGHATNKHNKCLLTVKPQGKHYKPENVGAPRKLPTGIRCLSILICARLTSSILVLKALVKPTEMETLDGEELLDENPEDTQEPTQSEVENSILRAFIDISYHEQQGFEDDE
jgi:hypothetical protein